MMIGAAVHLDAKPAVSPQLSLGAEPVRGLQNAQHYCRPDRTEGRNLREPPPDLLLLALHEKIWPPQGIAQLR